MTTNAAGKPKSSERGKLRIGDDWNAIRIIALSQSNPLKAIAELVENSIDARAKNVVITRGRELRQLYLKVKDDGDGVPRDANGLPDFKYVATHICDSIKRRLKEDGSGSGVQGEFGIGLLSFWTLGSTLSMTSMGANQHVYQMTMRKGDPRYTVSPKRALFGDTGAELKISPLLEGIRTISGEKIQWYLASELRDRIRDSHVRITVIDRLARKQYQVEPRQFDGRLLHQLPPARSPFGEAYAELYLTGPTEACRVSLTRQGTRVIEDLTILPDLDRPPWNSPYLQGLIDVPYLDVTPGTRSGIVHDERYSAFVRSLANLEAHLNGLIDAQRRAEEEQANRESLRAIQRAFREAMLVLPREEYDWFDVQVPSPPSPAHPSEPPPPDNIPADAEAEAVANVPAPHLADGETESTQRQFFDYGGPLHSVLISPGACTLGVTQTRRFRALPRDRSRRRVEQDLTFAWTLAEGSGVLSSTSDQEVMFEAPSLPELTRLAVTVSQGDLHCSAEALITVTDNLDVAVGPSSVSGRGLPGYTFERAGGALWRSRFDPDRNLIIVNSGHRDFVFAMRSRALQLRYLVRLYVKELVLKNFAGRPVEQVAERMIELSLYVEEKLKSS
ncbi:MAG TPA: ATP-binding protein [Candidatus Sulfotelmatobacter sp.]|nr:ATP-binding protein [Candidatus Sulfotelmatobacter sp.]